MVVVVSCTVISVIVSSYIQYTMCTIRTSLHLVGAYYVLAILCRGSMGSK